MTDEETLKREAEESFDSYKVTDEDYVVSPYSDDMGEKMLMYNYEYYAEETYLRLYKQGYLAGAEPREKRIAHLEATNKRIAVECHKLVDTLEKKQNEIADLKERLEWHEIESKVTPKREISKQYMPKNKEKVLLKYHFSGDDEVHISDGYYDAYDFEFHIANNPKFRIVCVIAWKEIQKESK